MLGGANPLLEMEQGRGKAVGGADHMISSKEIDGHFEAIRARWRDEKEERRLKEEEEQLLISTKNNTNLRY